MENDRCAIQWEFRFFLGFLQNDRGLAKTIPKAFEKPKAICSSFLVYADSAKDLMVYLANLLDSLQFPDISLLRLMDSVKDV